LHAHPFFCGGLSVTRTGGSAAARNPARDGPLVWRTGWLGYFGNQGSVIQLISSLLEMAEAVISGTVELSSVCYSWESNAISYLYLFGEDGAGFIVLLLADARLELRVTCAKRISHGGQPFLGFHSIGGWHFP
jgi:hypothetical protein